MHKQKSLVAATMLLAIAVTGFALGRYFQRQVAGVVLAESPATRVSFTISRDKLDTPPALTPADTTELSRDSHQLASMNEAADLDAVRELNTKVINKFLVPGWIHLTYNVVSELDEANNGTLSNGQSIPASYTSDGWYQIDDGGLIIESVVLMLSTDGQIVQVGVYADGVERNLALNEAADNHSPFPLNLDFGFFRDATVAKEAGLPVLQSIVALNQEQAAFYLIRESFTPPLSLRGFNQYVVGSEKRAYFDLTTGQLTQFDTVFIMVDGTERLGEGIRAIHVESGGVPPDSVLKYIAQEVAK